MRLVLLGVLRPVETTEHGATLIEPDFSLALIRRQGRGRPCTMVSLYLCEMPAPRLSGLLEGLAGRIRRCPDTRLTETSRLFDKRTELRELFFLFTSKYWLPLRDECGNSLLRIGSLTCRYDTTLLRLPSGI